jgi:hypothetical protein
MKFDMEIIIIPKNATDKQNKLHGLSPRANYTTLKMQYDLFCIWTHSNLITIVMM